LEGVENHGSRPEVAAALKGSVGRSQRRSGTVGRPLLYVAVPVDGGAGGVVRAAVDLSDVDAAVAGLRRDLATAAAMGLLGAVVLSYAIAWYTVRPLRELQRLTAAAADGDLGHPVPRHFGDEFGAIADSIRRLAEQLREQLAETTSEKERLQAVLDGMAEGVLVVDPEGQVALANDRVGELFSVSHGLVGRTSLEALRSPELSEALVAAARDDDPVSQTIQLHHPTPRTLRVQAVRFPGGARESMGTVAVFHDVTELAQLERMRREFVANASHELRTPLAAIRGFAETLLRPSDLSESDRRSYLEIIDRHARRLGQLVGDLLELSRIESGKTELEQAPVDVGVLIASLLREYELRAAEASITLASDVQAPAIARADSSAVEQILTNLLDNAIKYTEPGGSVVLQAMPVDGWLQIRVADDGPGIPEEDLARIFERFYRVDKARSRDLGGTGLGLAIVKHLAQSLGGEINVESEVSRGSTFTLLLPKA
jgi:two-component system phosphate regulon sensor histidine kinase PhoR